MKQSRVVNGLVVFVFLVVNHSLIEPTEALGLTKEQRDAVNETIDRYVETQAQQINKRPAIDFSQVIDWEGAQKAETEPVPNLDEATAFGLIRVQAIGTYSRGFQTQLRFFHLLNRQTQERTRVDVQSAAKAFVLTLTPGEYEVIRVQINEGPFTMESHASLKFHVRSGGVTYLGTWRFDVESPRTQRQVQVVISSEPETRDLILDKNARLLEQSLLVSLPHPTTDEYRLYGVAPAQSRSKYFYRR